MDYTDAFRLVNLGIGALMVVGGVFHILMEFGVSALITGLYVIAFGAVLALLEFQIPPQTSRYASFLFSFLGRGAFYLFIGTNLFDGHIINYIFGSVIALVGIVYIGLNFVPSIEPPANMREADGGWGAEQV